MKKEQNLDRVKLRAAIEPIAKWIASNRGAAAALHEAIQSRHTRVIHRQHFDRWFTPSAADRVEPRLGIGLVIIEESAKLMGNQNGNGKG